MGAQGPLAAPVSFPSAVKDLVPVLVPIPVQVKISCQRRCRCSYRSAVAGADLNPLLVPERLSVQDNYVTYVRIQEQVSLYRVR